MAHSFRMEAWAADKKEAWNRVCDKWGGHKEAFDWGTWFFFDWSVGKAWPTLSSMSKARKFGYMGYYDSFDCWIDTFRAFENAGILPPNHGHAQPKTSKAVEVNGVGKTESTNNVAAE